jgi:hypothetical protein
MAKHDAAPEMRSRGRFCPRLVPRCWSASPRVKPLLRPPPRVPSQAHCSPDRPICDHPGYESLGGFEKDSILRELVAEGDCVAVVGPALAGPSTLGRRHDVDRVHTSNAPCGATTMHPTIRGDERATQPVGIGMAVGTGRWPADATA